MTFNNHFTPIKEKEESAVAVAQRDLEKELEAKASKIHTLLAIGALIILPLYLIIDKRNLNPELFAQSVIVRIIACIIVGLALALHLKHKINSTALAYASVILPMLGYNFLCSQVPSSFLMLSNLYYVFVLIFCASLLDWHYKHSIISAALGLSSYLLCFAFLSKFSSYEMMQFGSPFLMIAYIGFPIVSYLHYRGLIKKTENELKLIAMNEQISNHKREIMKQNAQLREMNQMKDRFFSIISHDLRSPYQNILGFMELAIKNIKQTDRAERFLKLAYQSTSFSYQLLEDLLEWTHLQAENTDYEIEPLPLKQIVEECYSSLSNVADFKKIKLETTVQASEIAYINRNLVKTILRNLTTNAIKFTHEGGTVTIKSAITGDVRIIEVCDTGIGMSQEKLDKLFKNEQGFTSLGTKSEKGTGLGLMLCKDILEKTGGKIWAESELGKGSTFKFSFPNRNPSDN